MRLSTYWWRIYSTQQWPIGRIMEAYSLKHYQIADLEKLIEVSPWFSIARKELFLKMSAMGEEYRKDALHRTVLYLYPDYSTFREGYVLSSAARVQEEDRQETGRVYELDLAPRQQEEAVREETAAPAAVQPVAEEPRREIYVVGGDYFLPEELKNVQNQDISSLSTPLERVVEGDSSEFTDEAYYTETLARIYADQELYDRATGQMRFMRNLFCYIRKKVLTLQPLKTI